MADLNFSQGADPVAIYNDLSGNQLVVNSDGSINTQALLNYEVGQDKVFSLSGNFTAAVGGADNPIFMIKNPSGSGKTMKIRRLRVGCAVTNVIVEFKIFYAPTITLNGTSQTPRNNLIGSSTASAMTAFSLPTLSVLGTQILDVVIGQNSAAPVYETSLNVQANQTVVITAAPASNNRAVTIDVMWAEV